MGWHVTGYLQGAMSERRVFIDFQLEPDPHQVSDYPLPEEYIEPILEFLETTLSSPARQERLRKLWKLWSPPT